MCIYINLFCCRASVVQMGDTAVSMVMHVTPPPCHVKAATLRSHQEPKKPPKPTEEVILFFSAPGQQSNE